MTTIELWADVVCPWCYIGATRLERALAESPHGAGVTVVRRSFQLDPRAPRGVVRPVREMLEERYGGGVDAMNARVTAIAAADGLDLRLEHTLSGNTLDAHRVLQLAQERGVAAAAWQRLFRAHFTEERSLFDPASLADLAAEAGLDPAEVRDVLAGERYADAVAADVAAAREIGATGVPFFVADRRLAVSGAQPVDVLLALLDRAAAA